MSPLISLQAVRAIAFENRSAPSSPIFHTLQLSNLFELKLLTFVDESVNKISPSCFHEFFYLFSNVHQHDIRKACKGDIFVTRKTFCNMA